MKQSLIILLLLLAMSSCKKDAPPPVALDAPPAKTVIAAHPDEPISPGYSVVWCITLQLAWNEMIRQLGEDIRFKANAPVVENLNRQRYGADDVDRNRYMVVSGPRNTLDIEKIQNEIKNRFGDSAQPKLHKLLVQGRPDSLLSYSYLNAVMTFHYPFMRDDAAWYRFMGTPVSNFSTSDAVRDSYRVAQQVRVLSYHSVDDFIVELETKLTTDRMIAAKIRPKKSVADTIAAVIERMDDSKGQSLNAEDVFVMPVIRFDITYQDPRLNGALSLKKPLNRSYELMNEIQRISFDLNETGARLDSDALLDAAKDAAQPRRIIFDKPFLVLLMKKGARNPYFALWVGNTDLLVPVKAARQ